MVANDGATTYSLMVGASPSTVTIDLATVKAVAQVAIMPVSSNAGNWIKDFSVQGSNDNSTWTVIKSFTNQTAWTPGAFNLYNL
jgi:hypothetical protein